ncbi:MAG: glutamate--tRNA ligase family protein, partial [Anaerolineae bacterium]|nr:glutamate--tRNA ligase family protein [Anaerolineae bacterium]
VTHVLRADEWIPSTPRHILLYQAFGWEPPSFLHLPLILEKGGGKLSKRHGDVSVEAYRERGYLPEAVVNYLALLGWSPPDNQEILSREQLAAHFSWEKVAVSPAIFDLERLTWFNKSYIRHLPVEIVARDAAPYLQEVYGQEERSAGTAYDPQAWLELLLDNVREELDTLAQLPAHVAFAFIDEPAYTGEANAALQVPAASEVLNAFSEMVGKVAILDLPTANDLLSGLRSTLREKKNLGAREVMWPIRASLTGSIHGPNLAVVLALLGKDRCQERVLRVQQPS